VKFWRVISSQQDAQLTGVIAFSPRRRTGRVSAAASPRSDTSPAACENSGVGWERPSQRAAEACCCEWSATSSDWSPVDQSRPRGAARSKSQLRSRYQLDPRRAGRRSIAWRRRLPAERYVHCRSGCGSWPRPSGFGSAGPGLGAPCFLCHQLQSRSSRGSSRRSRSWLLLAPDGLVKPSKSRGSRSGLTPPSCRTYVQ
jgi:hypothetical protein